jgi:hypothetical protein
LRFVQTLARACAWALGETVAGVILHGSLTLDDYVQGCRDVDLLVAIDDPLSDARLAALTEAISSRRAEAPGPVDLRLVTRQVAASPTVGTAAPRPPWSGCSPSHEPAPWAIALGLVITDCVLTRWLHRNLKDGMPIRP